MTDTKEPRKRFRLRRLTSFSLRTALIAITVLAVWLGLHMNSVRKQRAAIEAVNGRVYYDYELEDNLVRLDLDAESPVPGWLLNVFGRDHFHSVVSVEIDFRYREASNDELFKDLPGWLPRLEGLTIAHLQLSNEDLKHVGQLTSLRNLLITDAPDVTDQGVAHLADLDQLECLSLHHIQLSDESLRVLSRLPKLEFLAFQGAVFTDDGLRNLQNMERLRRLKFYGDRTEITDDGLVHLKQLPQLQSLHLWGSHITDNGLVHLSQLTHLKSLHFRNSQITDDGLIHFKELTQLENLGLQGSQVTDDGLQHLVGLKRLDMLGLEGSQVKDASWLQNQLPNCFIDF